MSPSQSFKIGTGNSGNVWTHNLKEKPFTYVNCTGLNEPTALLLLGI